MQTKKERLATICRLLATMQISNQEELLRMLLHEGIQVTQATLSRDIKQLKVVKEPDGMGNYVYRLPVASQYPAQSQVTARHIPTTIEFSGQLAVIKTRPGYAMGIASDIDAHAPREILATIAGDDTILVIPREGVERRQVMDALSRFVEA